MAQLTIYATGTINWNTTDGWAQNADGSGTLYTNPQNGVDTYICNLNGKTVTQNVDVIVDSIIGSSGLLRMYGTRSLTASITYSGTSTGGFVTFVTTPVPTINGQVNNTNSGYCLYPSDVGVTINNVGGIALNNTGSGRAFYSTGIGVHTINGNVTVSAGVGIYINGNNAGTINGDIIVTSGYGIWDQAQVQGWTINGNMSATNLGLALFQSTASSRTVTWIGSRTLTDGADCYLYLANGTLNLANATGALTLSNSGSFCINKGSTHTLNISGAGGTASIVLQSATSYATILGGSAAQKAIITGPVLPSANNVAEGSGQYGYAGGLLTPALEVPTDEEIAEAVWTYGDRTLTV